MRSGLLDQVLNLPIEERFDLMMALLDSLPDDRLPMLNEARLADLANLIEEFQDYPEPSVQYDSVLARLRSGRRPQV